MVQSKLLLKFPTLYHFFFDKKNFSNLENLSFHPGQCIAVEQVHSNKLIVVKNDKQKHYFGADGLVTQEALFLAIKTADCLPIFFFEPKKEILAAVHAGWKGILSGIVGKTVKTMEDLGAQKDDIVCAIGPHIGSCCYNVSPDRISSFRKLGYNVKDIVGGGNNNLYLDLANIAKAEMLNFGMKKKNVDILNICTSCDEKFYSYRRDKNSAGRMWNVLGRIESA